MKGKVKAVLQITIFVIAAFALIVGLPACRAETNPIRSQQEEERMVPGGEPERGEELIKAYGCGACHTIPGVYGAHALVGPPLNSWAERQFIAGLMDNNPENLVRWIMNPQEFEPGTAMPNMEISEEEARHIAAYLFTLERKD